MEEKNNQIRHDTMTVTDPDDKSEATFIKPSVLP